MLLSFQTGPTTAGRSSPHGGEILSKEAEADRLRTHFRDIFQAKVGHWQTSRYGKRHPGLSGLEQTGHPATLAGSGRQGSHSTGGREDQVGRQRAGNSVFARRAGNRVLIRDSLLEAGVCDSDVAIIMAWMSGATYHLSHAHVDLHILTTRGVRLAHVIDLSDLQIFADDFLWSIWVLLSTSARLLWRGRYLCFLGGEILRNQFSRLRSVLTSTRCLGPRKHPATGNC